MAGIQVVNLQKVEGAGGNLGKHIDGERRPKTAVPRLGIPAVTHLDEEGKELTDGVKAAKKRATNAGTYIEDCRNRKYEVTRNGKKVREGVRGRKADPCSAFLFAGPPPYGDAGAWDQSRIRAWATTCIKWALDKGGKGVRVAHCALHQDEIAPHLHLVLVAADEKGRLGWNRIQQGFGTGKERGPELMSAMQTSFHNEVGKKFDLGRGEVGSTAKRQPIDRGKGLVARVEEERKRADDGISAAETRAAVAERRTELAERAAAGVMQRAVEEATVQVQGRIDGLDRGLAKAKRVMEDAKAEALNLARALSTAEGRAATAEGEVRTLQAVTESTTAVVNERDGLKRELAGVPKKVKEAVEAVVDEREGLKRELAGVPKKIEDAVKAVVDERDGLKRELAGVPKKIEDAVKAVVNERDGLKRELAGVPKKIEDAVKAVVNEREGLKRELAGVPKKIEDAVWEAVAQRNRDWQPVLEREVSTATREEKQRGADALEGAEQGARDAQNATGFAEQAMEEMRGERNAAQGKRDQALRDLETRTTELNDARTKRDEALGDAEKAEKDRDDWVERFVKVVRDLNPGRAELDRAAGQAGISERWLAQRVERGRGGMDR